MGHALSARVRMGVFSGTGAHCRGAEAGDGGGVSRYVFKLPDLGEGTVEAEIVNWRVKPGDTVAEDDVLVEVMTDKAAVELPARVGGRVLSRTGSPGDMVRVGSELIVLETQPDAAAPVTPAPAAKSAPASGGSGNGAAAVQATPAAARAGRVATSPAIRRRAHEAGIDLRQIAGSGPNGRIVPRDLDAYVARRAPQPTPLRAAPKAVPAARAAEARVAPSGATEEIKVIGLRRVIAQRMSEAKRNIPHFAYVEELDVTELESLRRHLNGALAPGAPALSYLPFLALALVRVLQDFPQCNAHYDAERGVIVRGAIAMRRTMTLSAPAAHRLVAGDDAAAMTGAVRGCLALAATIFIPA